MSHPSIISLFSTSCYLIRVKDGTVPDLKLNCFCVLVILNGVTAQSQYRVCSVLTAFIKVSHGRSVLGGQRRSLMEKLSPLSEH